MLPLLPYSDGDEFEEWLLDRVQNVGDLQTGSEELESLIRDFPSRYHMSSARANLLRPVSALLQGRVLEIGAGCGAVTHFLGENAAAVVSVEASRRRAAITASRCRDLSNVAVVFANILDMAPTADFDAVTVIGVLEYAHSTAPNAESPALALLEHARRFIRPGGTLFLAIENQLGLKYLALYPEDHLGSPRVGIEDRYPAGGPVTFGHGRLSALLQRAGFGHLRWFYPLPDYKFPSLIVTESGASNVDSRTMEWAAAQTALVDPQRPAAASFALQRVWPLVWRNSLLADLANSFLVAASDAPLVLDDALLATYYGGVRRRSFQKETRFVSEPSGTWVRRHRLHPAVKAKSSVLRFDPIDEPLAHGRILESDLVAHTANSGWSIGGWAPLLSPWFAALQSRFHLEQSLHPLMMVAGSAFDALPRNFVIADDGTGVFIDQEWTYERDLPLGYIVFRALFHALFAVEYCAPAAAGQPLEFRSLIGALFSVLGWHITDEMMHEYVALERGVYEIVSPSAPFTVADFAVMALRPSANLASADLAAENAALHVQMEDLLGKQRRAEDEVSRLRPIESHLTQLSADHSALELAYERAVADCERAVRDGKVARELAAIELQKLRAAMKRRNSEHRERQAAREQEHLAEIDAMRTQRDSFNTIVRSGAVRVELLQASVRDLSRAYAERQSMVEQAARHEALLLARNSELERVVRDLEQDLAQARIAVGQLGCSTGRRRRIVARLVPAWLRKLIPRYLVLFLRRRFGSDR